MSCRNPRREIAFSIWKEVFHDSDSFMSLYFQEVYSPEQTHLIVDYKHNKGIAHIQLLPYRIVVWGTRCGAGYISGAATNQEYRASGIMPQLMRRALVSMFQRGDIFSFLIPAEEWLYAYYTRKAGYASVTCRAIISPSQKENTSKLEVNRISLSTDVSVENYKNFIRFRRKDWFFPHVEHSYAQWRTIVKDAALSDGGHQEDYIIRYLGDVTQGVFTGATSKSIRSNPREKAIQIIAPSNFYPNAPIQKHGMLRIVRAEDALRLYAKTHPREMRTLDLIDYEIPKNTGRYRISSGKVLYQSLPPNRLSQRAFTPSQLAEELFQQTPFYIDLMLD